MENNQNRTDLSDIVNMIRETIPVASKNSVLVALLHESNKNYWNVLRGGVTSHLFSSFCVKSNQHQKLIILAPRNIFRKGGTTLIFGFLFLVINTMIFAGLSYHFIYMRALKNRYVPPLS